MYRLNNSPAFCIHIFGSEYAKVSQTLESISNQQGVEAEVVVYSLQPLIGFSEYPNICRLSQITIDSKNEIPAYFQQSSALYHAFIEAGTEYVGNCFDAVYTIFQRFEEVEWLYGVSLAKKNKRLFAPEPMIRKRSVQTGDTAGFIDSSSVFFSRTLFEKANWESFGIMPEKSVFSALWRLFFEHTELYAASLYVAYSGAKIPALKPSFSLKRWFFEKNIPYLRYRYYKKQKLVPIIRFDHQTKVYYLSEY